jgi:glycosyltransferase involved in cell wall biosynthesis
MRIVIVTHVVHHHWQEKIYAYGPYARELELWTQLFSSVIVAAPCRSETPPGDSLPVQAANIRIARQREAGGEGFFEKIALLLTLPVMVWSLCKAFYRADAIHVRCPGNLGLLGVLLAPLFSRRLVAKYAGQWSGFPGEAWTVKLQRRILRSRWWRGPVTVYGQPQEASLNVVPLFACAVDERQMDRARAAVAGRTLARARRVVFVGRLTASKNADVLLRALASANAKSASLSLEIIGDGPELASLRALSTELALQDYVCFRGALPGDTVFDCFERADILVLASQTEGWPKALTEAMAFGLVCIGSDRGLIPEMLEGRGIVVPPRNVEALTEALCRVARDPQHFSEVRMRAAAWAQQYTLERLRDALRGLLSERWGQPLITESEITRSGISA